MTESKSVKYTSDEELIIAASGTAVFFTINLKKLPSKGWSEKGVALSMPEGAKNSLKSSGDDQDKAGIEVKKRSFGVLMQQLLGLAKEPKDHSSRFRLRRIYDLKSWEWSDSVKPELVDSMNGLTPVRYTELVYLERQGTAGPVPIDHNLGVLILHLDTPSLDHNSLSTYYRFFNRAAGRRIVSNVITEKYGSFLSLNSAVSFEDVPQGYVVTNCIGLDFSEDSLNLSVQELEGFVDAPLIKLREFSTLTPSDSHGMTTSKDLSVRFDRAKTELRELHKATKFLTSRRGLAYTRSKDSQFPQLPLYFELIYFEIIVIAMLYRGFLREISVQSAAALPSGFLDSGSFANRVQRQNEALQNIGTFREDLFWFDVSLANALTSETPTCNKIFAALDDTFNIRTASVQLARQLDSQTQLLDIRRNILDSEEQFNRDILGTRLTALVGVAALWPIFVEIAAFLIPMINGWSAADTRPWATLCVALALVLFFLVERRKFKST